jgi:hypothetical protein
VKLIYAKKILFFFLTIFPPLKIVSGARNRLLTPVILATWEAEIKEDHILPWQKVSKTPSQPIAGYSGIHLSSQAMVESLK